MFEAALAKYLCDLLYLCQVGLLLLESLLLLGYFSLFHPGNQAVLRWGKGPTIIHKVSSKSLTGFLYVKELVRKKKN